MPGALLELLLLTDLAALAGILFLVELLHMVAAVAVDIHFKGKVVVAAAVALVTMLVVLVDQLRREQVLAAHFTVLLGAVLQQVQVTPPTLAVVVA